MTPQGASLQIAQRTWPGTAPPVLFVHATGFCKETWGPVVEELRAIGATNTAVAIDQPGHGDTPPPPGPPYDWWSLGAAVRAVAADLTSKIALGVGHSSGAAALVMAEVEEPGLFGALLLVEPIVFPPPYRRAGDNPLSAIAARRRESFGSRAEALDNFRGKGPFAGWDERALRAYVDGCLEARGGRWALKCRPEDEAEFYRSAGTHAVWERLPELARLPAVIVAAEHSDSHPADFAAAQADRAGATLVIVGGASHLVPMERPDVVAGLVAEMLEGGVPAGSR